MNEITKLQNLNIDQSINEGLEILFFHMLDETKSKYGFYMLRYPPDKEWIIPELYYNSHETRYINQSIILHSDVLNKYHLIKNINFINEKIIDSNLKCLQLPVTLLHPNIQIVLGFVNFDNTHADKFFIETFHKYMLLFCIQFLKKYIDNTINENNTSIIRTLGKIKSPIHEIIESKNLDNVKKPALTLAIIINDLVDLYKLKRNKLKLIREEINIFKLIASIQEIVEFKYIVDDIPEILFIDPKRLKQVLLNFINNESFVVISAEMIIDVNDDNTEIICWSIEFNIEKPETLIDERLFISKKLISLMGGYLIIDKDGTVKFTIEACKDQNSYSDNSLKRIKGKKFLIIDNNEQRRIDIGHKLQKWEIDIIFASNEMEGSLFLDETKNKIDLFIVGIPTFIDKINKFAVHKPYLQIIDTNNYEETLKNDFLIVKDITPINSPRIRKSSISKPMILSYPLDDMKLLATIIEVLN